MTLSKQPFFIVGSPRSGTTLLQRMFEAHPDVGFVHESNFFQTSHLYLEQHSSLFSSPPWPEVTENYFKSKPFMGQGLSKASVMEALGDIKQTSWHSVWTETLSLLQKQKNKPRLGEKTPHHVLYLDEIFKIFPDSKVILIVRDPRAVTPSMLEAGIGPTTVGQALMQWATLNAAGLSYSHRYPEKVSLVHYENLILQPQETLQHLCRFLELPFDPGMLRYHELPAEGSPFMKESFKQGVGKPLYATSLNSWKSKITLAEQLCIEKRCHLLMKRWGYQSEHSSISLKTWSMAWTLLVASWKTLRWVFSNNILSRQSYKSQAIGFWMVFFGPQK